MGQEFMFETRSSEGAMIMAIPTIHVNLDKKCKRCRKGGATLKNTLENLRILLTNSAFCSSF